MKRSTKRTAKATATKRATKTSGQGILLDGTIKEQISERIDQRDYPLGKPKAKSTYQGAPITATRVFRRTMSGFSKQQGNACEAETWVIVNDLLATYTSANTYCGRLPASYDPATYTYPINDNKKLAKLEKKIAEMFEVEVIEWPEWITQQVIPTEKKTRKTAKASK